VSYVRNTAGRACSNRARRLRPAVALLLAALLAVARDGSAQAQNAMVNRAFDLEQAGKFRDAIAAWRAVIAAGDGSQGVLGLERVFSQMAQDDSVLPALDTLLRDKPTDRVLRGVQLRVLRSLGREQEARQAFGEWTRLLPRDPAPYREYAGQLLNDGRAAAADTVLQQASRALGSTKALTIEVAQLRAALGLWTAAALAWREALLAEPYLEQAAVFSLASAAVAQRDSVRAVLHESTAAPVKKVLGSLELQWGAARDGWRAIASLTPADSAFDTWKDFADDAERQGAWLAARDALAAMNRQRPNAALALRAASAALTGGEPASALDQLEAARKGMQPFQVRLQVLPMEVRALASLGRAAEAERLVRESEEFFDSRTRQAYARQIAWGWIRAGQVEKARTALAGASGDDEDEVSAWIALYDGDLARARTGLRRPSEATPEVVTVIALLGRTRVDSSHTVGAAFLALARGDSVQAAVRFERAADELSDAAPLLLALAARVQTARRQDGAAAVLWQRILLRYATAPEAAEADLEWGRSLRRKGDTKGATEHFEHLILSYPQSALVPQARRELEAVRNGASSV
jgi:tetratricopeptide (TPR) repeat protein